MNTYQKVVGFLKGSEWRIGALISAVALLATGPALAADPEVQPAKPPIGTVSIYSGQTSDIFAVGFNERNTADPAVGGTEGGRATFGGLKVIKAIDATSPQIVLDVATIRHLPKVTVEILLPGPPESGPGGPAMS